MNSTRKKRILMTNEAHFLFSGYSKYGFEVLSRLADTGKYDIAELASYGKINDIRDINANWMYYPNAVDERSPLYPAYKSNPQNEFGRWRFERTCLDFKPDFVFDIRDPYVNTFLSMSPLRPFYHLVLMPTVDSAPQNDTWLSDFIDADGIMTYSQYGTDVLKKECGGMANIIGSASPGVDHTVFKPVQNRAYHRKRMGFMNNCNIVGTIMRNQPRKLYPDIMEAFRKFIDLCYETDNKAIADSTYLYLHCSYPDDGWEIPDLLREYGLGRKTLFTYICDHCKHVFCSFFRDAKAVCSNCNHVTATLPNVSKGVTPEQLSLILNTFDLYVQYSVCEGFGMPMVEAAGCGVPIMAVNYSAMEDVLKKTNGIPLKVERFFWDQGTGSQRALPNNAACASDMLNFFKKPEALKRKMGLTARKAVEQHYTWDNTAKIWEDYFDNTQLSGLQGQWDAPLLPCGEPPQLEGAIKLDNQQFVDWLFTNVIRDTSKLNSKMALKYLAQLNTGFRRKGDKMITINKKSLYSEFCNWAMNKRDCEFARKGRIELEPMEFIKYAHLRKEYL